MVVPSGLPPTYRAESDRSERPRLHSTQKCDRCLAVSSTIAKILETTRSLSARVQMFEVTNTELNHKSGTAQKRRPGIWARVFP